MHARNDGWNNHVLVICVALDEEGELADSATFDILLYPQSEGPVDLEEIIGYKGFDDASRLIDLKLPDGTVRSINTY